MSRPLKDFSPNKRHNLESAGESKPVNTDEIISRAEHQRLIRKFNDLSRRYDSLSRKYDECVKYSQTCYEKYKDAKRSVKVWQAWLDQRTRCKEMSRALRSQQTESHLPNPHGENKPQSQGKASNRASHVIGAEFDDAVIDPGDPNSTQLFLSEQDQQDVPGQAPDSKGEAEVVTYPPNTSVLFPSSAQTTESELPVSPLLETPIFDDDDPVVVSEKTLKRKRGHANARRVSPRIKQEEDSPGTVKIAPATWNSPPEIPPYPQRIDTSDLDALVEHNRTPRKSKGNRKQQRRRLGRSRAGPEAASPKASSTVEPNPQTGLNDEMPMTTAKTSNPAATEGARPATFPHVQNLSSCESTPSSVLRPMDVNTVPNPQSNSVHSQFERQKRRRRNEHRIGHISEDGDHENSQAHIQGPKPVIDSNIKSRLRALLDNPSFSHEILLSRETNKHSIVLKEPDGQRTSEPQGKKLQQKQPSNSTKSPQIIQRGAVPLRQLPLECLTLDDFCININYVGTDFAFSDTLRGRDQRQCLQGCTRPDCCGEKFRKAAEIGPLHLGAGSDAEVLESYLGPEWLVLLRTHAPDKQKDILVQARAAALANQFGRHRLAFERPSTPPGFWRTDMPTTQEEEEDREKAMNMERRKIEERRMDAMRTNGRWRFRDE